jgi:hypothetical protein
MEGLVAANIVSLIFSLSLLSRLIFVQSLGVKLEKEVGIRELRLK